MSASEITYDDIHHLLTSFGFIWELRTPERRARGVSPRASVVYRHEATGISLIFPFKDSRPALEGDLASLRMHLLGRGHLDDHAFDRFLVHGAETVKS